jgi:hypothetical protein
MKNRNTGLIAAVLGEVLACQKQVAIELFENSFSQSQIQENL